MPLPLACAGAVPPAAATCYTGAAAAAKHLALHAAPFLDLTTLSSASFAAVLLRYYWKNKVPAWAKEDISFQKLLRRKQRNRKNGDNNDNDNNDDDETMEELSSSEREELEMANLASVLEKLQALVESVQLDDDHPSTLQLHAALLAYIQLSAQIKQQEGVQTQPPIQSELHDEKEVATSEEKKEEESSEQEPMEGPWSSRDSLYQSARPSEATISNVPPEYYRFAQNPTSENEESSPVRHTLQQALSFATWAYYDDSEILSDKLAAEDYSLLKHSIENRPGHVAYYMAVSSVAKKQIIIGIRGTSTLEELCTDACGRSVVFDDTPYYYEHDRGTKRNVESNHHDPARIEVKAATPHQVIANEDEGESHVEVISGHERIWVEDHVPSISQKKKKKNLRQDSTSCNDDDGNGNDDHLLRCHEGIMISAKRLVNALQSQIEYWVLQRDYQLVISGHSLGAGAASLAAVILRSRLPELVKVPNKIRVFAFAPPPVLDHRAAMAASSYCTSIVNNADIIPRCSLANLLVQLEILRKVLEKLQEQELAPTSVKTMAAFVKKIAQGRDGDMLMTLTECRQMMRQAMCQVQANNYSTRKNAIPLKEEQTREEVGSCCDCVRSGTSATASMDGIEIVDDDGDGDDDQIEAISETKASTMTRVVPLYIPGVVLLAHEPWQAPNEVVSSNDLKKGTEQVEKESDDQRKSAGAQQEPKVEWTVTDGTADVLHLLEFDNFTLRMLTDHITTSYYTILDMEYEF